MSGQGGEREGKLALLARSKGMQNLRDEEQDSWIAT